MVEEFLFNVIFFFLNDIVLSFLDKHSNVSWTAFYFTIFLEVLHAFVPTSFSFQFFDKLFNNILLGWIGFLPLLLMLLLEFGADIFSTSNLLIFKKKRVILNNYAFNLNATKN